MKNRLKFLPTTNNPQRTQGKRPQRQSFFFRNSKKNEKCRLNPNECRFCTIIFIFIIRYFAPLKLARIIFNTQGEINRQSGCNDAKNVHKYSD
jgi:hypothetical protein